VKEEDREEAVKGAATRSCERRKGTRPRKIEKKAEED
jgi:hypothetical protein